MKKNIHKLLKTMPYLIIAILVGVTVAYAGSLTPPGSVGGTMYSLEDIYNLANGTSTTENSGAIGATPGSVSATGKTLTEVYNAVESALAGAGGGVLQTGQSHCNAYSMDYGSNSQIPCTDTNQDGDYQRGTARDYTDNGDGTISDNAAGLMWQKCSDGQTGLDCSGGSAVGVLFDDGNGDLGAGHTPAIDYCENLSLATHTDWRLPNINELQFLVDYGEVNPAINTTYFPNTQSGVYWSSTAYEDSSNYAWVVDFDDGYMGYYNMNDSYYVRCVRG